MCKILEDPANFDNKWVRIRGHVTVNFDYSLIGDDECQDKIWFMYGDGSAPPGLFARIDRTDRPSEKAAKGRRAAPIKIKLKRDSSSDQFSKRLAQAIETNKRSPGDRFVQRVTATFIGRIDGVSTQIHREHVATGTNARPDFKGFGQMGIFDAQLVVRSVQGDSLSETYDLVRRELADPMTPPDVHVDLPEISPQFFRQNRLIPR